MRFYVDEDISARVAMILQAMRIDAISSQEQGRNGTDDREQVLFATSLERCIVTNNVRDFHGLSLQFDREGIVHTGI